MAMFKVIGVMKETGADAELEIEADTKNNARVKAEMQGLVVTDVKSPKSFNPSTNLVLMVAMVVVGAIVVAVILTSRPSSTNPDTVSDEKDETRRSGLTASSTSGEIEPTPDTGDQKWSTLGFDSKGDKNGPDGPYGRGPRNMKWYKEGWSFDESRGGAGRYHIRSKGLPLEYLTNLKLPKMEVGIVSAFGPRWTNAVEDSGKAAEFAVWLDFDRDSKQQEDQIRAAARIVSEVVGESTSGVDVWIRDQILETDGKGTKTRAGRFQMVMISKVTSSRIKALIVIRPPSHESLGGLIVIGT